MCIGGGPVGPQKYSGGSSSASTMGDDKQRDSEGNTFGSAAYHDKIRSDAERRRTTGSREAAEGRKGQKSLLSILKGLT